MHIIDGHNLIPKIPGMSLKHLDDEEKLLALLQVYARVRRRSEIEVFFDNAPPGHSGVRTVGGMRVHFVAAGKPADDAIRQYLDFLGRRARNATVVSSDRMVQANARERQARVQSSDDFAAELVAARDEEAARTAPPAKQKRAKPAAPAAEPPRAEPPKPSRADQELAEWYNLFGIDAKEAEKPIEPPATSFRPKKYRPAAYPPNPPGKDSGKKKKKGR